jgi:chromosome segregation ATPase
VTIEQDFAMLHRNMEYDHNTAALARIEAEMGFLQAVVRQREGQIREGETEVERLREESATQMERVIEEQQENKRLRAELEAHRLRGDEAWHCRIDTLKAENELLQAALQDANDKLTTRQQVSDPAYFEALKTEAERLREKARLAEEGEHKLELENERLRKHDSEWAAREHAALQEVERLREERDIARQVTTAWVAENERLREDKEHLELECDELVHENERLRTDIGEDGLAPRLEQLRAVVDEAIATPHGTLHCALVNILRGAW